MELNNIIFAFLLLIFGYLFSKYFLSIFEKSKSNLLLDNQFRKPQAFHEFPTNKLGGITIFIKFNFNNFFLVNFGFFVFTFL